MITSVSITFTGSYNFTIRSDIVPFVFREIGRLDSVAITNFVSIYLVSVLVGLRSPPTHVDPVFPLSQRAW